jgi:hypothetical protein
VERRKAFAHRHSAICAETMLARPLELLYGFELLALVRRLRGHGATIRRPPAGNRQAP